MRWLLVTHGVLPGAYYALPDGENEMIRALLHDRLRKE